jgi:hypothetical protein
MTQFDRGRRIDSIDELNLSKRKAFSENDLKKRDENVLLSGRTRDLSA